MHPSPHNEKEQSGFTGGFIVQSYGSHNSQPIDAIQLEFGAEYRAPGKRAKTAEVLTDALVEYAGLYLQVKVPDESNTSESTLQSPTPFGREAELSAYQCDPLENNKPENANRVQ